MSNNPVSGAGYALRGLKLITVPGLRRFVAVPFAVNLVVFGLLVWLGVHQFEILLDWLLPEDRWWSFLRWLLWPLFALTLVLAVFFTFTAVANLIAAPFNGLLAEKVEHYLNGSLHEQISGDRGLWQEIVPAVSSELRKLRYFLIRAVPLLILLLIPGVNLVASVLWAGFSAWFVSLEYADYPMGNHGKAFADQLACLKRQSLLTLGFGGGITLLMMIPLVQFVAMPAAVAGATALWCERLEGDCGH